MIPKASQRAGGQDLATHLLNAHDNEYVELAEVRGAVADDLHGAFAEWEAIAHNLTRCRNYLYSLSVNPDLGQGQLSRDQYRDYADRVEKALGLTGQPRALVFHIKEGREHCHIVWSRIDARAGKAIHQPFDHDKLMMVTREFARDHGLALPAGYERGGDDRKKKSLYETQQERNSGITKEERMAAVTAAWKRSDSPRAFVRALEEMGYVLATGNRPYVLVDLYGNMNALPKMIDDRSVRTKDISAFLESEFPPDSLPTVDEAKALVAAHRQAREDFVKSGRDAKKLDLLKAAQGARRSKIEAAQAAMLTRHRDEKLALAKEHTAARRQVKALYLDEVRRVKESRLAAKPTGLAAFLGRVTGVSFVIGKIHKHQDAQRHAAYQAEKAALVERQVDAKRMLDHRHLLQVMDAAREVRALAQIEARELKSYEVSQRRQERMAQRQGHDHMSALNLTLKPKGRSAVPHKAKDRYRARDRQRDDDRHDDRRHHLSKDQDIVIAVDRRPEDDRSNLRKAFGAAVKKRAEKADAEKSGKVAGKGESARGGRGGGGDGGDGAARRRQRTRRREQEIEVPDDQVPVFETPPPDMPEPHWTELPLADKFHDAARDRDEAGSENGAGGRRIKPSRSARGNERGDDDRDFERER
ncbi:relaxase/mobilization nuclease domain-containing protein [Rhizorhapis sp. SPR117]|uniref:relaxase/mobilization nuclease domain-containing protein n=1 Tax=Rhizorhapis sp. SPR117 TaxID=2912611 RepID=UPI001F373960|nr:relaxase/mobilization nuclease domain-containing protein [Rhizorhapis sp. SPR117]